VAKALSRHQAKLPERWLPGEAFNGDMRPINPDDIEAVFFTAASG